MTVFAFWEGWIFACALTDQLFPCWGIQCTRTHSGRRDEHHGAMKTGSGAKKDRHTRVQSRQTTFKDRQAKEPKKGQEKRPSFCGLVLFRHVNGLRPSIFISFLHNPLLVFVKMRLPRGATLATKATSRRRLCLLSSSLSINIRLWPLAQSSPGPPLNYYTRDDPIAPPPACNFSKFPLRRQFIVSLYTSICYISQPHVLCSYLFSQGDAAF